MTEEQFDFQMANLDILDALYIELKPVLDFLEKLLKGVIYG